MLIYGIDFTSRPRRSKPITCVVCTLEDTHLQFNSLQEWRNFEAFEAALEQPGPWMAGIDFPFGQARRFIETIAWPKNWLDYVERVGQMTREQFRESLDAYRRDRLDGDKEHRRQTDIEAGSISPQKLYGTPVGLMFYEGAPRLQKSGATIPLLQRGDPKRIVVEAYPGVLARALIGRRSYKQDTKAKQTQEQYQARADLLTIIKNGKLLSTHGITVDAPDDLINDPGADHLDALLCAIQAAWAYRQKDNNYGIPASADPMEGWIAHPSDITI
ncbi:MAG: hypothetical protein ACJA04_000893 [Cellvibrionaceae bacterium]|jgi:hypothetical protein